MTKPLPPAVLKERRQQLRPQQQQFVVEWLKHGNGGRAAIAAGYKASNAYGTASTMLKSPLIQAEIARVKARRAERTDISAERVLQQAQRMAFVDPRAYFAEDGSMIPVQELSDEAAAALQSLEVELGQNGKLKTRYKMVDRGAAVERLMRHLGLFERDNTQAVDAVGNLLASIHSAGSRIGVKP